MRRKPLRTPTSNVRSFHRFRDLPTEIRLLVYKFDMEEDKSFTYEEVGRPESEFVCWRPFTVDVDCLEYAVPIICHAIPEALADWTRHAIFELQRSYRVLERISYLEHSPLRFNLQSVRKLDIPPFKLIELDKNPSTTLTKHQIYMEAIKRCSNIYVVQFSAWSNLTPAALDLPRNWDEWSLETKRDHVVRFYALEQLLKCEQLQELFLSFSRSRHRPR
jgi:hypothetical protein